MKLQGTKTLRTTAGELLKSPKDVKIKAAIYLIIAGILVLACVFCTAIAVKIESASKNDKPKTSKFEKIELT